MIDCFAVVWEKIRQVSLSYAMFMYLCTADSWNLEMPASGIAMPIDPNYHIEHFPPGMYEPACVLGISNIKYGCTSMSNIHYTEFAMFLDWLSTRFVVFM